MQIKSRRERTWGATVGRPHDRKPVMPDNKPTNRERLRSGDVMRAAIVFWVAVVMPPVSAAQPAAVAGAPALFAPIARVEEGAVTVDGQLAEWGAFAEFLDEQADWVCGSITPQRRDRAAFALGWSDKALYVAVKVSDASVHNPFAPDKFSQGDCVELFFDFRPPAGAAPLGKQEYTPGVYQFLLCPPVEDKGARAHPGSTGGTKATGVQVAGALTEGGYTLAACRT